MITLDFETRSACDLLKAGAWAYSKHPTTEVMCACFHFEEDPIDKVYEWQAGYPHVGIDQSEFPQELADRVANGEILEAHNAFFEWCIWNHVWRLMLPDLPELPLGQIKCSAAKAAAFALPRALNKAIDALGLPTKKDMDGSARMKRLSKPRKPKAAERKQMIAEGLDPDEVILWNEDPDDIRANTKYCAQDVRAEHGLSSVLRDLIPREHEFWQMDLRMNARGITCDVAMVHICIGLAEEEIAEKTVILGNLTDGRVPKASSRAKFKDWVIDNGLPIPNTQGGTIDAVLSGELDDLPELQGLEVPDKVRQAMEIFRDLNRSSIAKYQQMLVQLSDEDRLRDMMLYCGASRTGRWSGKGTQPHNFIRGYSGLAMDLACLIIMQNDPEAIKMMYNGSVMEVLSKATRGALVAAPGKKLMVADFAAIEARVLLWLALADEALQVFYRGEDIYLDMASAIFKYACNKKDHPFERQVGKQAVLGLGYQMGWEKFEDTCRDKAGITDQEPKFFKDVVNVYRKEKFPEVASFWYDMEEAAIQAVRKYNPKVSAKGPRVECRRITWFMWGQFLHMELPSGRLLSYCRPVIKVRWSYQFSAVNERGHVCSVMVTVPANTSEAKARYRARSVAKAAKKVLVPNVEPNLFKGDTLTFMHENSVTRKWERKETYGGELVENATQAAARDLMAEAMLRADYHETYDVLLSVHDELIAECDEDKGSVEEFEDLLAQIPPWADGCPVEAEGWEGKRYRK